MSTFLEALEDAETDLDEIEEITFDAYLEAAETTEDLHLIAECYGLELGEVIELHEELKKRVSYRGKVKRVKSRKVRQRRAVMTTGMSRMALKKRARKSARTRRRNPSIVRKANRRRKRALRQRKLRGLS